MSAITSETQQSLGALSSMFSGGLHTRHVVFGAALPILMVALTVLNGFSTADESKLATANAGILSTAVGVALVGIQDVIKGWQQFKTAQKAVTAQATGTSNIPPTSTSSTYSSNGQSTSASTTSIPTQTVVTVTHPSIDVKTA